MQISPAGFYFWTWLVLLFPLGNPPARMASLIQPVFNRLSELPNEERPGFAAIYTQFRTAVDSVAIRSEDALFFVNGDTIHFAGGRLLSPRHWAQKDRFDPIFYSYPIGPLTERPPLRSMPRRSSDFFDALYGKTEKAVRRHCAEARFLGRFVFLNKDCLPALMRVEAAIRDAAQTSQSVREYLASIEICYSFMRKQVVGASHASLHSYGLALDLVPDDYGGKHVYWKWSRVFHPEQWHRIPLNRRWHPPQAVIDAFEANGFVWGGKWSHFDTIHFEYRPEIIALAKANSKGGISGR